MDRIMQLQVKSRQGKMTPAEISELKTLIANAPAPFTTMPTKTTEQTAKDKAEFDKAVAAQKIKDSQPQDLTYPRAVDAQKIKDSQPQDLTYPDVAGVKGLWKKKVPPKSVPATVKSESNVGKLPEFPFASMAQPVEVAPSTKKTFLPAEKAIVIEPVKVPEVPKVPKVPEVPVKVPEVPEVPEEPVIDNEGNFKKTIKELAVKYGVPLLEIIEAVGKYRGGITTPTYLDRKFQEKFNKIEKDYISNLENKRIENQQIADSKKIAQQQEFEAHQNELNRLAAKEARGEELSSAEKIALMNLTGRAKAKIKGLNFNEEPSIIPE